MRNSLLVNLGTAHAVQCASPSYDGDPRPTLDGSPDFADADRIP